MKYKILEKLDHLYHKLFITQGTFFWYYMRWMCDSYDYYIAKHSVGYSEEDLEMMRIDDKLNAIEMRQKYKYMKAN